jgi:hypothetical protein
MNTKFLVENIEVTSQTHDVSVKLGKMETVVEGLNLLDYVQLMKSMPAIVKELRRAIEEPLDYGHSEACMFCPSFATVDDNDQWDNDDDHHHNADDNHDNVLHETPVPSYAVINDDDSDDNNDDDDDDMDDVEVVSDKKHDDEPCNVPVY